MKRSNLRPVILLVFLCVFSALLPVGAFEPSKLIARINVYRRGAGLTLVVEDPELSTGCMAHARYLIDNAVSADQDFTPHEEDPKKPGYTAGGARCAENSAIISTVEPELGMDYWMATLFHRVPFLQPRLRRVGAGAAAGGEWRWATVVDVFSGVDAAGTASAAEGVPYPGPDQSGVPITFGLFREGFDVREHPDPIAQDADRRAGYPVTLSFFESQKITQVVAFLYEVSAAGQGPAEKKTQLPVYLSSPERPAFAGKEGVGLQQNTIGLIAHQPLKSETTYEVDIQAQVNGNALHRTWRFTTAAAAQPAARPKKSRKARGGDS